MGCRELRHASGVIRTAANGRLVVMCFGATVNP